MSNAFDKASLVMLPHAYEEGKLYSLKPTDRSGDFTFSRGADTATRVGEDGYIKKEHSNLLTYSNTMTNAAWTWNGGSATGGQTDRDGGSDAYLVTRSSGGSVLGERSVSLSGVYTFSIYVKINASNGIGLAFDNTAQIARFDISNENQTTAVISTGLIDSTQEYVGNNFYRLTISSNTTATLVRLYMLDAAGTNNDSGGGSHIIQDAQLEQGMVARDYIETTTAPVFGGLTDNMPRLDYTDATCPSLLLEPSRTNVWEYSEYLDYSFASVTGITTTQNTNETLSPEGLYNVTKLEGVGSWSLRDFIAGTDTGTWTISCYVKAVNASSNNTFRLSVGGNNFSSNLTATSEWQRFDFSVTDGGATAAGLLRDSSANDGDLYIYGMQVEQGSYPTSYIPTYGSAQTRPAEENAYLYNLQSKGIYEGGEYSFYIDTRNDIITDADVDNSRVVVIEESSGNDIFTFRKEGIGFRTFYNLDGQWLGNESAKGKYCYVASNSSIKTYVNGELHNTLNYTSSPFGLDRLNFQYGHNDRTIFKLGGFSFFNKALSETEAKALTAL